MGSSYDAAEALIEEELAGVEEARQDALEVAQEADAPPQAGAKDASAIIRFLARAGSPVEQFHPVWVRPKDENWRLAFHAP